MLEQSFLEYVKKFGDYQKRSMFGGTGLFMQDAMYALLADNQVHVRGGGDLNVLFASLGCKKYQHVKKQTIATVNYYNISHLFSDRHEKLDHIIERSIEVAIKRRDYKRSSTNRRLRDLPNMQLTLERMVKKSGVKDVSTFMKLGAPVVFNRVRQTYGNDVDLKLLWKFAGAIEGVHWELIEEPKKQNLLSSCNV
ncbi:TfoX/Sxy family DNA transformation protein [Vibrio maerlii]|uniref:TfoX/Sxy family DNA transformation protein n=1 Tax=Vibrio maerlii TaxID=2231648 RepID=UPI000E3CA8DB|nr:TfoX/Sxy family DNA transformation protein [Vibrio maerlii]